MKADAELLERARKAGWPDDLTHRVARLHPDRGMVDDWIERRFPDADGVDQWATQQEAIFDGPLRLREATWADHDLVADLYANAPEDVGDWEVVTERSPNPFAQLRLQDRGSMQVLEERRIGLGVAARSVRNTLIGGQELTVQFLQGWRVRAGHRGKGYSNYLQWAPGPGTSWFGLVTYWYVRDGNDAASWIERVVDDLTSRPPTHAAANHGLSVTVLHVSPGHRAAGPGDAGRRSASIRPAAADDLDRCVELINRTNTGLDLTRPLHTADLRQRLDDPTWGPKPSFLEPVYGWPDYHVAEREGRIVACGGLWDRGRHLRERWRHKQTGQQHEISSTALLDAGWEEGAEPDMIDLITAFAHRTREAGRDSLLVSLEHHPAITGGLSHLETRPESRSVHVLAFPLPGLDDFHPPPVTRPMTDLAFW